MSKLQEKPAAHKRGHPTLQNMNFFLLLWVIFALLSPDPDSGSGSTGPIESGSNPDPDPKPCFFRKLSSVFSHSFFVLYNSRYVIKTLDQVLKKTRHSRKYFAISMTGRVPHSFFFNHDRAILVRQHYTLYGRHCTLITVLDEWYLMVNST